MKKTIVKPLVLAVPFLVAVIYFSSTTVGNATNQAASVVTTSHSDIPIHRDMTSLVNAATYVLVGKVEGVAGTRNFARDVQDSAKEDPENYVEGVDYKVKVSEVLKGEITEKEILVTETRSVRFGKNAPSTVSDQYVGLKEGEDYVFFAQKSETSGRFFNVGQPFFFALKNNQVELKSNEKQLADKFPIMKFEDFKTKMKNK
ncbi:hypothetical protein [Tumebacillus flagellatus]|uniref:Uncharacterized protein n=1 Tax=Tumebacillus flagellatus TaxID=1157490 RepID=A0A074LUJ4_9BACL|nr:hypothetical protein [Tumebacillus flagellatus]KEO84265.1 hypothetical protein EL26_05730 [Tumebacillus flagellatus]